MLRNIFPKENQIPQKYKIEKKINQKSYLVNGELKKWNGENQKVFSPILIQKDNGTLEPNELGSYPLLEEQQALEVLDSAVGAYNNGRGLWPTMSLEDRLVHFEKFISLMLEKRNQVVNLLMWEIGKTLPDAQKEFDRTIIYIKDTIDSLKDIDRQSSRFIAEEGVIAQVRRAPLGVVLCMGPFNYPLNETFTTLIPALMMGNTLIFKPPKLGVLLHEPLLEVFKEAFPKGVVNTVYGDGQKVIGPLMRSGKIDCLAFIGTSKVADILRNQHPKPHRLKNVLGLEAKNVGIVLPDANLELAAKECLLGSLSYNGQRCTALKLIFVHKTISEKFNAAFLENLEKLKFGMPWEEGISLTPLPEEGKPETLMQMVEDATAHGAKIINKNGGEKIGSFFYPAVVFPVSPKSRLYKEEQFGPIVAITEYDDIEEPINSVVQSDYGQQLSIFGNDPQMVSALIDPLVNQVCRVNINAQCQRGPDSLPFTGRKDSAENTLSVSDALKVFSIRTMVATKATDDNKKLLNSILKERKSNFLSTDYIF